MDAVISTEVQEQVREIVSLLMKRPITEEIAVRIETYEGFDHLEITDGEWVGFEEGEFMGGEEHGWIETIIIHALMSWVLKNNSGRVYPGDTVFVLDGEPGNLQVKRRPDVAFVHSDRVQATRGYCYSAPDLAVEIISPSERPGAIRDKLNTYLQFGVQQVWQVYPDNRQVVVNYPDGSSKTYGISDVIPGSDLLPGFELAVKTIFEK